MVRRLRRRVVDDAEGGRRGSASPGGGTRRVEGGGRDLRNAWLWKESTDYADYTDCDRARPATSETRSARNLLVNSPPAKSGWLDQLARREKLRSTPTNNISKACQDVQAQATHDPNQRNLRNLRIHSPNPARSQTSPSPPNHHGTTTPPAPTHPADPGAICVIQHLSAKSADPSVSRPSPGHEKGAPPRAPDPQKPVFHVKQPFRMACLRPFGGSPPAPAPANPTD